MLVLAEIVAGQPERLSHQGGQSAQIYREFLSQRFCIMVAVALRCEMRNIYQALQWVADMVCQLVRNRGCCCFFRLLQQRLLLSLMPNRQGAEVCQDSHHLSVVLVECRTAAMSHDEDGASCLLHEIAFS